MGANVLFAALTATAACGVGGDDGGIQQPPPVNDGEICNASFAITGTFAPGTTPRPTDPDTGLPLTGCWPVGTWTFQATVAGNMCQTTPMVLPRYSFKVERVLVDPTNPTGDTMQKLTNLTDIGSMQYHLAVSSNGQGCEANFEFGSMDGTQYWNMQPTLAKDPGVTTLSGGGDYVLYKGNGWPWK